MHSVYVGDRYKKYTENSVVIVMCFLPILIAEFP